MQATLVSKKYAEILGRIYQHPASHSLEWTHIVTLMAHLGTVDVTDDGHLAFSINGVAKAFHCSHANGRPSAQQILDIRQFLTDADGGSPEPDTIVRQPQLQLLVVINQQEAMVFRSARKNSVPERLRPDDPTGTLHDLYHIKGGDAAARNPENVTYYAKIAAALAGAEEVVLMGNGTGASSAMGHLNDYLALHHPELARRFVASLTVDIEALTKRQMLQQARAYFLHHRRLDR